MRWTANLVITLVCGLCLPLAMANAQESQTVLKGLTNPCGIAVQPETGTVFVADSGAGRILRMVDGKPEDVIVDFPMDVYGKGPKVNIGPLGLAFINKTTLVVGGGGMPDGQELLRVYEVPEAGQPAIKADKMAASFSLPETDEIKGEGNFYALAVGKNGVYVTCNGDDTKGWVSKAAVKGSQVTGYERFLATKEATGVDAPVAITVDSKGHLVVGQMGEVTLPNDSLLTFYNEEGKMLLNLKTNLHDIAGLAYSPTTGQLYAVDYHWPDGKEGGLFRLESVRGDDGQEIRARKIADLVRPTAMAFTPDGSLYVTVVGSPENEKSGSVVRFTGL